MSRDFYKEANFGEALDNGTLCFKSPDDSIRDSVQDVLNDDKINDNSEKTPFWMLSAALSKFKNLTGALPLSGKVPDMTSTTDFYIQL